MNNRVSKGGLQVAASLYQLIQDEILPGSGVDETQFWTGFDSLIHGLSPINHALLQTRDDIQGQLDDWYRQHAQQAWDMDSYQEFLREIGYLVPVGEDFDITTTGVDAEIAHVAGPQLVVPVNNARFAINAANARWGSLYDALYGTDAIADSDGCERGAEFNSQRASRVIEWTMHFLDQSLPLAVGSHAEVKAYQIHDTTTGKQLQVVRLDGEVTGLADPKQFVGVGADKQDEVILFVNNGLHIELQIDREDSIGQLSKAGVKDVVLESALSTIQDCEDSVAAVDADDKVGVYRNWLGLMKGDLTETFTKGGQTITRTLNQPRRYNGADGSTLELSGRSLLLVRNVGHLMTTDAILDNQGNEIPEGILDAVLTSLCALHDLRGSRQNSPAGSVYIVKPKMHGPEEVAFTNQLFNQVEDLLGLERYTLKVGVMDEERRTSVNLKECIRAVKDRLVFINTGFLDRTGDEIHTSMEAGAVFSKDKIKDQPWINAYEDWNMDTGLACGLQGKAQIGKGMWAKPDEMAQMLASKQAHPEAGANCAWVPSPTAATLHATHYHQVLVSARQQQLKQRDFASLDDLLTPPLAIGETLSPEQIQTELDSNVQSLLGYVVRWIDQGVGCSKVPDINNVGLMEDRATLRISSQLLANWLRHGVCSKEQLMDTLQRMAIVVDQQNSQDSQYQPMAPDFNGIAFHAACDLVFKGAEQPNGYTEPLLHARRRERKAVG